MCAKKKKNGLVSTTFLSFSESDDREQNSFVYLSRIALDLFTHPSK